MGHLRRSRRAARDHPGGHRRVRDHRPPREVLSRVRRRARGRFQRGRGRHGVGQGQGRGLHRPGGARAPPRGGAGRDHVHPHRRRPHFEVRRQALHARPRADPHARGRTDHRPQGPPLVCDQRRRGAVDRQAHPDGLPAARARRRRGRAGRRVHGRALSGYRRDQRLDPGVRPARTPASDPEPTSVRP